MGELAALIVAGDFASQPASAVVAFVSPSTRRSMSRQSFIAPAPEALAEVLPGYDFECLIAKGGMGAVYRAKQRSLGRHVAIKILPREFGNDPQFRESFVTEARAMARLNHPNLIGVYDCGSADGILYIVMEYVPGKSLYHSSYGKKVDPEQAVELIQGICAGLEHAHENGIIHRDIKPSNILLTPKAEPKIGDFGLARLIESERPGLVMGTPGYTAPEVIGNPQAADRRSDLYAVGAILYELVTGQRHHAGAPPPSTLCGCGPGIDEIWRRATHPDPTHRFQDARALHAALADWRLKPKTAAGPIKAAPPAVARANPNPVVAKGGRVPAAKGGPIASPGRGRRRGAGSSVVPMVDFEIKSDWHFIRNLLIIAAAVIAVALIWKHPPHPSTDPEIAKPRVIDEPVPLTAGQQAEEKELVRELANQAANPTPPVASPPPVKPSKQESPLESLTRLRLNLLAGKRNEMPPGVVRRADRDYLLIPTPMTWADAAWFAERFGGHLPIPISADDIHWLGQQAPAEEFVWLGGGRSGDSNWTFLDGSAWRITPLPEGTGTHAAVNRLGLVSALDSKITKPFLIQWHRDGSNPASLEAALRATRESLGQGKPLFPPGTATFEDRHYLYVARPMQWRDAADLAEQSGGHLAVASDTAELTQIAQFANRVVAPDGIWLGAFLKASEWFWVTGEPWAAAKWPTENAPTQGALALLVRPETGWDSQDLSLLASGFIIEWSADRDRPASPPPSAAPADTDGPLALTVRAKELVTAADRKRSAQLAVNARTCTWDLDQWLKTLSANDKANWQLHVAQIKAAIQNSRVPSEIPRDSDIKLSPAMAKILSTAAEKQSQINTSFLAEVNKIRLAYLTKINAAALAAEQSGPPNLAASLRADSQQAATTEGWIRSLGLDPSVN